MNGIPSPYEDERVSAYIDGELPESEREEFERLLEQREEYQQAVGELSSIREAVQGLPRLSLPGDFSQRVLQRAERTMLTTSSIETVKSLDDPQSSKRGKERNIRRWIWPLAAVAAALLILLSQTWIARERGIALNDSPEDVGSLRAPRGDETRNLEVTTDRERDKMALKSAVDNEEVESDGEELLLRAKDTRRASDTAGTQVGQAPQGPLARESVPSRGRRQTQSKTSTQPSPAQATDVFSAATDRPDATPPAEGYWSSIPSTFQDQLDAVANVTVVGPDAIEGFQVACKQNRLTCQPSLGVFQQQSAVETDATGRLEQLKKSSDLQQLKALSEDLKKQDSLARSEGPFSEPRQAFQSYLVEADAKGMEQLVNDLRSQNLQVDLIANVSAQAVEVNRMFRFQPPGGQSLIQDDGLYQPESNRSNRRYPRLVPSSGLSADGDDGDQSSAVGGQSSGTKFQEDPDPLMEGREAAEKNMDRDELGEEPEFTEGLQAQTARVEAKSSVMEEADPRAPTLRVLFCFPLPANQSGGTVVPAETTDRN